MKVEKFTLRPIHAEEALRLDIFSSPGVDMEFKFVVGIKKLNAFDIFLPLKYLLPLFVRASLKKKFQCNLFM